MEDARGGWTLHVQCAVCRTEATFEAVIMTFAAEYAEKAGWTVDRDALYASASDRYALCPKHHD